ncbi:hypothetical protein, partial [Lentilactobacillus kefiri]|uniref:hypothetical protein n=1 Tax=Lentilactobacillus kefiri TaxID=33962 RepID=UPI001FBA73EE
MLLLIWIFLFISLFSTGGFGFLNLFNVWRIVKLSATVCQKILHMGFHSLTLCEDVDLTAFG